LSQLLGEVVLRVIVIPIILPQLAIISAIPKILVP
jgi:hypothetical protein